MRAVAGLFILITVAAGDTPGCAAGATAHGGTHPLPGQRSGGTTTFPVPVRFDAVLSDGEHLPACPDEETPAGFKRGAVCHNCSDECEASGGSCSCIACGKCNACDQCFCCLPQAAADLRAARAVSTAAVSAAVAGVGQGAGATDRRTKLLFAIANWVDASNPKSIPHLTNMLGQVRRMSLANFAVHVVVYSTADVRHLLERVATGGMFTWEVLNRPAGLRFSLTHEHRALFAAYQYDYDLFTYQEDDQLLTLEHLRSFIAENERLQATASAPGATGFDAGGSDRVADMVPGFFRVEQQPRPQQPAGEATAASIDDSEFWANFNTEGGILPPFIMVGNEPYFACKPPVWCYSGGMLATRAQLQKFAAAPGYFSRGTGCPTSTRETAAEEMYCTSRTGLLKVIPVRRTAAFRLHHLANKDVSKAPCVAAAAAAVSLPASGASIGRMSDRTVAELTGACDGFAPWPALKERVQVLLQGVDRHNAETPATTTAQAEGSRAQTQKATTAADNNFGKMDPTKMLKRLKKLQRRLAALNGLETKIAAGKVTGSPKMDAKLAERVAIKAEITALTARARAQA